MIQEGIVDLFEQDAAFQAAVGTPDTRADSKNGIFPLTMPEGATLPCIVYFEVAAHESDTLDGRGELKYARFQFSAYGDTYASALAARTAAENAFLGFRGLLSDGTSVDNVTLALHHDAFEQVPKIYQVSFDAEALYRIAET